MGLGYISVKLIPGCEDRISRHVTYAGVIPMSPGDYHCTLIYDRRPELIEPLTVVDPDKSFIGVITGIREMGERKGNVVKTIALEIASGDLQLEFNRLIEAGYEHSFPEFKGHISLAYDIDYYSADRLKTQLKALLGETVVFCGETIENIKD